MGGALASRDATASDSMPWSRRVLRLAPTYAAPVSTSPPPRRWKRGSTSVPDVGRLIYWAHWITPSSAPRRYDTRFFLVAAPPLQSVIADAGEIDGTGETVESAWMRPAELIAAAKRGEMPISNPTLFNLHELQAALVQRGSLEELLKQEAARTVVPVLPKILRDSGISTIVLPWDPDYNSSPGDGIALDSAYHGTLRALPSRMTG